VIAPLREGWPVVWAEAATEGAPMIRPVRSKTRSTAIVPQAFKHGLGELFCLFWLFLPVKKGKIFSFQVKGVFFFFFFFSPPRPPPQNKNFFFCFFFFF